MVLDSITDLAAYGALNRHFATVCAYLEQHSLADLSEGKYPIDGDNVYVAISERDLKKPADAALEAHDRYIDIQVVLEKKRSLCAAPRGEMNQEKDVIFYNDVPETYFTLGPGEMGIFFPQDAHAPLVGEGHVKKAVIKVKVE